jgi:hypothetical protein
VEENTGKLMDKSLDTIKTKEILLIDDTFGLATFEDSIEELFQLNGVYGNNISWPRRTPLANMLRPRKYRGTKYHGKLFNISLEVMENPVEELTEVKSQKYLKFYDGQHLNQQYIDSVIRNADDCVLGFDISANGKSTGQNEFGITSKVWYFRGLHSDIRRIITEPVVEAGPDKPIVRDLGRVASMAGKSAKHSIFKTSRFR